MIPLHITIYYSSITSFLLNKETCRMLYTHKMLLPRGCICINQLFLGIQCIRNCKVTSFRERLQYENQKKRGAGTHCRTNLRCEIIKRMMRKQSYWLRGRSGMRGGICGPGRVGIKGAGSPPIALCTACAVLAACMTCAADGRGAFIAI